MQKTDNKSRVQIECTVKRIRFYKESFGIIVVTVDKVVKGELQTDPEETVLKGAMPRVREGEAYKVAGTYTEDPKWGGQYNIEMITSNVTLDDSDREGQRKFLESIYTPRQVENMYDALENPYEVLKNEDYEKLITVKGVRANKATDFIIKFRNNFHRARIYSELSDYNLSISIIDKLLNRYKTPDLVIEKVKENPYTLITEVRGIGWGIADNIAQAGGMSEYDPRRIAAFIFYYLDERGEDGFSWITNEELIGAIEERFGEDISDEPIIEAIHSIEDKLWWNEDKSKLGLKYYYTIEDKIAQELLRLRDAESHFEYPNWEDAIRRIERLQGWEYTDEQKNVIKVILDNNITLIQGGAGTGKSSIVRAIIECLKKYSFVQCALSGKAASRLMEVTGKDGFTIHRLLEYPKGPDEKAGFNKNDENPLKFDLYIIDEISMVDMKLFYYLLRAIPNGSKIICLGDNGQLEAIGAGNIAYDMLVSPEITSITLNKIHRQAENSAIVTESVKIRKGYQIIEKDWVGHEVRGALKDLDLTCYSDRSNTYYEVLGKFQIAMKECHNNIKDVQVIVPMKLKGACTYALNNAIQELYNPSSRSKKEYTMYAAKDMPYSLRVGDKVICTQNNYKIQPNIYNGNVGVIERFGYDDDDGEEIMVVNFDSIGTVRIPKQFWKTIELAYALTVHKDQGSESDYVIFGLDYSAYALLSKELVYTGITRAKKKCYLIAETGALRYATSKSSVRIKQTHLQERLNSLAHPKIIF